MNQNYSELKQTLDYIKAQFSPDGQWRYGKVQKIFSSGKILNLSVRLPGKTLNIALGRGDKYCGVYLLTETIPSEYRIVKDQYLEYFRKHIRGKAIVSIDLDDLDRICRFKFIDKSEIYFFWKGGNLHFTHYYVEKDKKYIFSPWVSLSRMESEEVDFSLFDEVGRRQIEIRDPKDEYVKLSYNAFEEGSSKQTKKEAKKLQRKISLIEKDLEICSRWEELQDLAVKDLLELNVSKLNWKGVKVSFVGIDGHYKKRDKVFEKIKKLKKGAKILEQRLLEAKDKLENKEVKVVQKIIYPIWKVGSVKKENKIKQDSEVVYLDFKNYKISLGKSAKANDWLRKIWAKKSDLWIHLEGYKSSHLFVKNFESFDMEDFAVMCSILADYSDFDSSMIPVIFTQVSNLKGVKGVPGKVNYKKEKHLVVTKVNWKEIISSAWS